MKKCSHENVLKGTREICYVFDTESKPWHSRYPFTVWVVICQDCGEVLTCEEQL